MEDKVKLQVMANRFRLSVTEISIILNIDNWTDSNVTVEAIADVYRKILDNSEAQNVALKKWEELCSTMQDAKYFFDKTNPQSKSRKIALKKWDDLALQAVEKANTLEEIISVHNQLYKESEVRGFLLKKWDDLALQAVEKISTIEEAGAVYGLIFNTSDAKKAALERWNELSFKEIEKANTLEEIISLYEKAPYKELLGMVNVQDIATKKGIDFCTTVQAIKKLFYSNPYHSSYPENMQIKWILEKWSELLLLEIERTSTIKEVKDIMGNIPSSCPFREILYPAIGRAHKRWGELCTSYQELRQYITDCSPYSDEEISAIKRLIPLCTEVDQANELWHYREKTQDIAFLKWDELSLLEVEKAMTLDEIFVADLRAPCGGGAKVVAMEKYLKLL